MPQVLLFTAFWSGFFFIPYFLYPLSPIFSNFFMYNLYFFIFYIFLKPVPVFLPFPFFRVYISTFSDLIPRFHIQLHLFWRIKCKKVMNYAFPLDSPKMMPVAIKWATLRGSGILLLIEVSRIIFFTLFRPIPAFWI